MKFFKIFVPLLLLVVVLVVGALMLAPRLFNVEKYNQLIEQKVSAAVGLPVRFGEDLQFSLFPWVGFSLSGLQIGNPEGFTDENLLEVSRVQARVKVMPLFSKTIEIDKVILDGPRVFLEKKADGHANWMAVGGGKKKETAAAKKDAAGDVTIPAFSAEKLHLADGRITFRDGTKGSVRQVSDVHLQLSQVSLVNPVALDFQMKVDGKPLAISGTIGPIGTKPGYGDIPFDLHLSVIDEVQAGIKGVITEPVTKLSYKMRLDCTPFSLRSVLTALNIPLPLTPADPQVLNKVAVAMELAGNTSSITVSGGQFTLDDSTLKFTAAAPSFTPLSLRYDGKLDTIDLDRYLPAPKELPKQQATEQTTRQPAKAIDYAPLRALDIEAGVHVGQLKMRGGELQNLLVQLKGKKGVFNLAPFSFDIYGGKFTSKSIVNVQGADPKTEIEMTTSAIQVGPLLKDFLNQDRLEGALESTVSVRLQGDTPDEILPSLHGKGNLLFTDGAVVGFDLSGMVNNVSTAFGGTPSGERPRTDFSELSAPFTLKNGIFTTTGTSLSSPLLRVNVQGDANLVAQTLDMRVQPKFVATLVGQGDTVQRSGVMVPVTVTGTFTAPKFRPDVQELMKTQVVDELLEKNIQKDVVPKEQLDTVKKGVKGLLSF